MHDNLGLVVIAQTSENPVLLFSNVLSMQQAWLSHASTSEEALEGVKAFRSYLQSRIIHSQDIGLHVSNDYKPLSPH